MGYGCGRQGLAARSVSPTLGWPIELRWVASDQMPLGKSKGWVTSMSRPFRSACRTDSPCIRGRNRLPSLPRSQKLLQVVVSYVGHSWISWCPSQLREGGPYQAQTAAFSQSPRSPSRRSWCFPLSLPMANCSGMGQPALGPTRRECTAASISRQWWQATR